MENVFFIFRVLHNLLQTLEGLREFETVMQTPEEGIIQLSYPI